MRECMRAKLNPKDARILTRTRSVASRLLPKGKMRMLRFLKITVAQQRILCVKWPRNIISFFFCFSSNSQVFLFIFKLFFLLDFCRRTELRCRFLFLLGSLKVKCPNRALNDSKTFRRTYRYSETRITSLLFRLMAVLVCRRSGHD